MTNLFQAAKIEKDVPIPLAERMRPQSLSDVVGQEHLTSHGAPLARMLEKGGLSSMILWGPPGCGKTTIAKILASQSGLDFDILSAIFSGVADLRKVFDTAKIRREQGRGTILFVDEIHRFNKSQQDAFLPVVEDGTIILIGATTENPSFELNAALLSRCQVLVLKRLDDHSLDNLILKAEQVYNKPLPVDDGGRETLKAMADGDGRYLLTLIEQVYGQDKILDKEHLSNLLQKRAPLYDKSDDGHYNLISALHKSVRGSDPDAALYWFARMLAGGEDPRFLIRRMIRMASEDIGLADPQALPQIIAAADAYERLGHPEGELALAQALIYLATAPKSNAVYTAYKSAMQSAKNSGSLTPPKHILNAPTKMMKQQEYGTGYIYDHDTPEGFSGQNYFPDAMDRQSYYTPPERGFEREILKRLEYWSKLRGK